MPTIRVNAPYVTQINHIRVAPENQDAMIARMIAQDEEVMSRQPGFISSAIHKGRDGRDVVNDVQFESTELLDAAHASPAFKAHCEAYRAHILDAGPTIYDIAYIRER